MITSKQKELIVELIDAVDYAALATDQQRGCEMMATTDDITAPMSPAEFAEKMAEIVQNYDLEEAHIEADHLMGDLLAKLGYEKGVKVFYNADKWYA